jgi:hypothetical protein
MAASPCVKGAWTPEEVTTTTQHLTHGLMLLAPMLVFAGLFVLEWRRSSDERVPPALQLMAVLTAASGVVHGAVVHHHAQQAAVLGWFFALVALAQLVWVLAVLIAPVRGVVVAGALGNLWLVTLWAWTRAVGIPFGVAGGLRQRVETADLLATGLEVAALLLGLLWVYSATGGRPPPALVPWSKWETSTITNSPPPRKVGVPSGAVPSQDTNSLRPSVRSTLATRS